MARPADNFRSVIGLTLFFGTTIVGLMIDLWTKALAVAHLQGQPQARFIPDWLHFTYTENGGAVFGLGQGRRALFILVSIGAIAFLTYLYALSEKRRLQQIFLGMLLAGVLGNMYDRVMFGYVRDMIFALPGFRWPGTWQIGFLNYPAPPDRIVFPWIFNIADTLLCVGVFLIVVYSLWQQWNAPVAAEDSAADAPQPAPQKQRHQTT